MSRSAPIELPRAVSEPLERLAAGGHEAHLFGRCVAACLDGEATRDFALATSARTPDLLALFPNAVPLDGRGARLLLPTAAGEMDLVPHAHGGGVHAELEHCAFTIHALALDASGRLLDPHDGRADAAAGRLRCVGTPSRRLAEDPLRALRAARLVATQGLDADPELEAALPDARDGLAAQPPHRLRAELHALLCGPRVARGLGLLRRSGLEARLAPEVADDAAAVVAELPPELELRLAGWLRATRAVRILRRLREPRPRIVAVERLLDLHPIDARVRTTHDRRRSRLFRRIEHSWPGLIALRAAEIRARGEGGEAQRALALAREALEHAAAPTGGSLALDGRAVMEILDCPPGPAIGRALRQLEKTVEADPSLNTPEALRDRLLAWRSDPAAEG